VLQVATGLVFTVFTCILILFGIIGKLSAVFIAISYPVLGGVQIIGFGIFMGLVMSNLQYIDMQSTINLAIIGVSTLLQNQNTSKHGKYESGRNLQHT
jgi:nucleobase transporter 1/2